MDDTSGWYTRLSSDRDLNDRAVANYNSHTDLDERTLHYCTDILPPIIIENYSNGRKTVEESGVFRYLGIGSGSGLYDIQLLKELKKWVSSIKATIVDPSQESMEKFQQSITEEAAGLDGVTFEFKVMTIQAFQSDWDGVGFDCITGFNVMYYIPNHNDVLAWITSSLADNGTVVIQVVTADNGISTLYAKFAYLFKTKVNVLGQDVIEACLKSSGAKSAHTITMEASIDVTECSDENAEGGNLLFDFFTHSINFRKTAPPTLLNDYLEMLSCKGIGVEKDGKMYINNNCDFVIGTK
ncbi:histamine N-methyltransferase A-like [Glandiceps talaboti]